MLLAKRHDRQEALGENFLSHAAKTKLANLGLGMFSSLFLTLSFPSMHPVRPPSVRRSPVALCARTSGVVVRWKSGGAFRLYSVIVNSVLERSETRADCFFLSTFSNRRLTLQLGVYF